MTIFGRYIETRFVVLALSIVGIIVATSFLVSSCDARRDRAAQERVEEAQTGAAQQSGAEAVNTVANAGERESVSEGQSREAERDIRGAEGASDPVKAPVRDAGLAALCRRKTYENDPRCRTRP
jgi:hypothetical protein